MTEFLALVLPPDIQIEHTSFDDLTVVKSWPDLGFKVVDESTDYVYDTWQEMLDDPVVGGWPPADYHWSNITNQVRYAQGVLWNVERHGVGLHLPELDARWMVQQLYELEEAGAQ